MKQSYEIKTLEVMTVIACAHIGDYAKMEEAYTRLAHWAAPRGLMADKYVMAAIYYDHPMMTPVEQLRSDACLLVQSDVEVDSGIEKKTIGGGKFFVGHFALTMAEFGYAWKAIADEMEAQGRKMGDGVPFELYPDCAKNINGGVDSIWTVDICMPID